MDNKQYYVIWGKKDGERVDSRLLEENIQEAVERGYRDIKVWAYGQHGIGGRLWKAQNESVNIRIEGHPGQRIGSMGFDNTTIEVMGPASDDVGWLNAGALIIVNGHAGNGVANAMAQGKIYVSGNIGARGMTMTKANPRFAPPELWVLGSVGDYFGEFMAGGIAVVCGINPQNPGQVLGYRPLVGMVGGKVFFRGPQPDYSQTDAHLLPISAAEWDWLKENIAIYLKQISREELYEALSDPTQWQLLAARKPHEKSPRKLASMAHFRKTVWDQELGQGGLIGDLTPLDRSPIPLIVTGDLRRYVPVWENRTYAAPCESACPTGIPVHDRWRLIREGRVDEAIDLALAYTPFPAAICGYLCPNLCMQSCTRHIMDMRPVDIKPLGRASLKARLPELPPLSGRRVAVIGGGPAGISVAYQLRRLGHEAVIYDRAKVLGGKMASAIPGSRIPEEVLSTELARVAAILSHVHLKQPLTPDEVARMCHDFDYVVVAVGANRPMSLPLPGNKRLVTALDFLIQAKGDKIKTGSDVVIIGAGNVGCDAATEAFRLGAEKVTLIDIQEPASFGEERRAAEAAGATFRYPCYTREVTPKGVNLTTGEVLPADTVIVAIGDKPELDFLPADVTQEKGFITVNAHFQTSVPNLFAIGDAVKLGLLTDAIGAGRKVAQAIDHLINGRTLAGVPRAAIDKKRVSLVYFDPRLSTGAELDQCGAACASCGACRDCGICVALCPEGAISRKALENDDFAMVVDDEKCIGCGFCAAGCPCGIWDLKVNTPVPGV